MAAFSCRCAVRRLCGDSLVVIPQPAQASTINPSKKRLRFWLLASLFPLSLHALAADVVWFDGKNPVAYSVCTQRDKVVDVALSMFSSDMRAVTGLDANKKGNAPIEIYQLDRLTDKEFGQLSKYSVPIHQFITKRDAFYLANTGRKIIVVGSNGRGTAYGIMQLSRLAGVSPWIWWGSVAPQRQCTLVMKDGFRSLQIPQVEYRGLSIDAEGWSLREWSHRRMDRHLPVGSIGPQTYKRLFELMIRLRANLLWPADDAGTKAFFHVKGNAEVADSCGIIIGSEDPMLRSNKSEWSSRMGAYNYATNHHQMLRYWEDGLKLAGNTEALFTLGLGRGAAANIATAHDGRQLFLKVIHEQMKLTKKTEDKLNKKNKHKSREYEWLLVVDDDVRRLLDEGMQTPEAPILIWPDDGYGYMLPMGRGGGSKQRGGDGILYHLSYEGSPHDYLWLATTQPGLMATQLDEAVAKRADKAWIAVVHEPKVAALQLSLFFGKAWNANAVRQDNIEHYLADWLCQQFGPTVGQRLVPVMREYFRLTAIRKPELMGWNRVGEADPAKAAAIPVNDTELSTDDFGNEMERYLADYQKLSARVDEISSQVAPHLSDAFFTAIAYPIKASAAMAAKQLFSQEARDLSRPGTFHHDEEALEAAVASLNAYDDINSLTEQYSTLASGRWAGLMNAAPRGLQVFQSPSLPAAVTDKERKQYRNAPLLTPRLDQENAVAMNASQYDGSTGTVTPVPMLGHSMRAVRMAPGSSLHFTFRLSSQSDACLYLGFVPFHAADGGRQRVSVSFDGGQPLVLDLACAMQSDEWQRAVLRGQLVKRIPITVGGFQSRHTLNITAIDEGICLDQWMIDFLKERSFYLMPTN